MKIIRRIGVKPTPSEREKLATYGIRIIDSGFFAFDMDESDKHWPDVRLWLTERRAGSDIPRTEFTKEEIASAKWLDLRPEWHYGYPQPDSDNSGYLTATYDLTDFCEKCGIGLKQKAPFQMKAEPKWGRRSVLQMNWVFDEYFVKPELWQSLFKPHGVKCRPVMNRKGIELKTVVQLDIQDEVGLVSKSLSPMRCELCGRTKYQYHRRGFFPALQALPSVHMVKSKEYFGSGGLARKAVFVSQQLASAFNSQQVRGASFGPTLT